VGYISSQILNDEAAKFFAAGKGSTISKAADYLLRSIGQRSTTEKFASTLQEKGIALPKMWAVTNKDDSNTTYLFFAETEQDVLNKFGTYQPPKPIPQTTLAKMIYTRLRRFKHITKNAYQAQYLQRLGLDTKILTDIDTVAKMQEVVEKLPQWIESRARKDLKKIMTKYVIDDAIVKEAWNLQAVDEVMES
jgi:hypothetical protein